MPVSIKFLLLLFCLVIPKVSFGQTCPTTIVWSEQRSFGFTHPPNFCGGTLVTNEFDIRISSRLVRDAAWSDDITMPTVWFATGGRSQDFVTDKCDVVGVRHLAEGLWNKGARIVEIRFKHALGPTPDERYRGTHSCQHSALGEAIKTVREIPIADAPDERWWPIQQVNRFGFGISEGQVLWQFAVDVLDEASTSVNRLLVGGGGAVTELYQRVNCDSKSNDGQKILDAIDFSFRAARNGQPPSCACKQDADDEGTCNDVAMNCSGDPALFNDLMQASIGDYIGQADDAERASQILANTGFDLGCNQQSNRDYVDQRQGNEAMWDFKTCLCGCTISGHGPINAFAEIFGHAEPWSTFFLTGKMDLAPTACPAVVDCPLPPPVDNLELPNCQRTLFANDFEAKSDFLN